MLEDLIYEAALVPEGWPTVLHELSMVADAEGGLLFGNVDGRLVWTADAALRQTASDFVTTGWLTQNSRVRNGIRKGLDKIPRFMTEADFFDEGEWTDDPFYTGFLRPHGLGWHAGLSVALPHGDLIFLSLEKAFDKGPVVAEALLQLDALRPHLARAAMIAARLEFDRLRSATDTLGELGLAAAAVRGDGRILLANHLFQTDSSHWTTGAGDRLALIDPSAERLLGAALQQIASAGSVGTIPLRDGDGFVRAVLNLVPIRRSARDVFAAAAAIAVISCPRPDGVGSVPVLQVLFDLTAAEAEVARRVANGVSVASIARESGRSVHTIRNQLRNAMEKTGCSRQVELVVLLHQIGHSGS
jgi:DNA-binding CsgD family transcriptional regulator